MLSARVFVNKPAGQAIGIKEDLAMAVEEYGTTLVTEVREDAEASGLRIVIHIDAADELAAAVLATLNARAVDYGDMKVLDVAAIPQEQMDMYKLLRQALEEDAHKRR